MVITGGARGIGKVTAERFLKAGARVAIADLDAELVEATARELTALGPVQAYGMDVRDGERFREVVARIERELGPIDVLINNAGIMSVGSFLDQPERADSRQIEVNLLGVINGMRAVLPGMRERGQGHVINIASMAGKVPIPHAAVYAATKHAVVGLTEAVRAELRGSGVDFSYVMPVPVRTELIAGATPMLWPPVVEPEDVATAIFEAYRRRRVDVFVPGSQRLAALLPVLLPRRAAEWLGDLFGLDRLFGKLDEKARAAYVARTTGREDGGAPNIRVVGR